MGYGICPFPRVRLPMGNHEQTNGGCLLYNPSTRDPPQPRTSSAERFCFGVGVGVGVGVGIGVGVGVGFGIGVGVGVGIGIGIGIGIGVGIASDSRYATTSSITLPCTSVSLRSFPL
jgi:hypothetical protein